jgi:hypothetical protein
MFLPIRKGDEACDLLACFEQSLREAAGRDGRAPFGLCV